MDGEEIIKCGYLVKLDRVSQRSWKKRYFVLTENTLIYCESDTSLNNPKGTLCLFADSTVNREEHSSSAGKTQLQNCFVVSTPYTNLHLSASSPEEQDEWIKVIREVISKLPTLPRGMITKKGGFFDGGTKKKFFVLHNTTLTFHEDESKVKVIQGTMPIKGMKVDCEDSAFITLTRNRDIWQLTFGVDEAMAYDTWKTALEELRDHAMAKQVSANFSNSSMTKTKSDEGAKLLVAETARQERGECAEDAEKKKGELLIRPPAGGEVWDCFIVSLTSTHLEIFDLNTPTGVPALCGRYQMTLSCAAFETNLGQFSFEVVTPLRILHLRGPNKAEVVDWVTRIREVIVSSRADPSDPLFHGAMLKINEDSMYNVTFSEQKPLGVVLERAGEWGIVLKSNAADSQIHVGSALTAVNGKSVILGSYSETIKLLKGWKPPLELKFREAPSKSGWLMKQSIGKTKKSEMLKNWKRRYFCMANGRIIYREGEDPKSSVKGDLPLMGSAVSLVSSTDSKRFYCFRLVSGITSLVMQASSSEEMMEWACALHHATFIANGGNHIVGLAKARIAQEKRKKEEEEARAEAARLKQLEIEEAERQLAAEEEAERIRRAALAAEEVARLEAEDAARKALLVEMESKLNSAMVEVGSCKPFRMEVLDHLQSTIQTYRNQPGCNEVLILKAEMLASDTLSRHSMHMEVLRLLNDCLETNTIAAITHALAEASFIEGFESEQSELIATVKQQLADLQARESVLIRIQEAIDAQDMDGIRSGYDDAMSLHIAADTDILEVAKELLAPEDAEDQVVEEEEEATVVQESMEELRVDTGNDGDSEAVSVSASKEPSVAAIAREESGTISPKESPEKCSSPMHADGPASASKSISSAAAAKFASLSSPLHETNPELAHADEGLENHDDSDDEEEEEPEQDKDADTSAVKTADVPPESAPVPVEAPVDGPSKFAAMRAAFGGGSAPKTAGGPSKRMSYHDAIRINKATNMTKRQKELEKQKVRKPYDLTNPELATEVEIKKVFHSYCRSLDELAASGMDVSRGEFLNPMQFSSIFRLVTEEKSNLFKEMQMFKRFDVENNASVNEEEFVTGWFNLSKQEDHGEYLYKIKKLVGEDNILL